MPWIHSRLSVTTFRPPSRMHCAALVCFFFAVLFSCVHPAHAHDGTPTSISEQNEALATILLPERTFPALHARIDDSNTESQPTGTIEEEDPSFDEVDGDNSWPCPPAESANLLSPPNSTSTLSLYAHGPVIYCNPICVRWAGGVSPYTLYYMLLEPGQTFSDYTYEYIVSTQRSYGPVAIVQLGDQDMRLGRKQRGLTRIRIEDATGTSEMAWVQNLERKPGTGCLGSIGGHTPKPPTVSSTVKFDGYTTVGSGPQRTTAMVATIDGQPTTIFPTVPLGLRPSVSAQPGPDPSFAAPPRPTGVMPTGSAVGGSNGEINASNSDAPNGNPQLGGQVGQEQQTPRPFMAKLSIRHPIRPTAGARLV
ncbi:SubName: Full=Uncharacterized protein {ECO:0000313/EMBL:CCA71083.1} [Serendipita indica DSM 11827]|nr:SubName: Full=Uncharacterized protein {ECO:0000313/EMBL:CCA71083.1} [Serendipita indica DSM 11827]